jgi:hypothetical protein
MKEMPSPELCEAIEAIDRLIEINERDLCGLRNKYRKDHIRRKIANLQRRRATIIELSKEAA